MNCAAKRLAAAIEDDSKKFATIQRIMGNKSLLTKACLHELEGMTKAFEIVTGERYIDYFLRTVEEGEGGN